MLHRARRGRRRFVGLGFGFTAAAAWRSLGDMWWHSHRVAGVIAAAGVLVATAAVPLARAQATDDELARVLLRLDDDRVRVITNDGRSLEGAIAVGGDGAVTLRSDASAETVPTSDITTVFVWTTRREPVTIGGFVGGFLGEAVGFAAGDVNAVYTSGIGTALGWGVGFAFRHRSAEWEQVYPPPPPGADGFTRRGWFLGGTFGGGYVDGAVRDGVIDEVFLAGATGLGVMLSPRFALSLGSRSWIQSDFIQLDGYHVLSMFLLSGSWASAGSGWSLRAGGGPAVGERNDFDGEDDVSEWGWGATATAAYEMRVGKTTLVGPELSVDYIRVDGDTFGDATLVTLGLRLVRY
jgi:hypothetical protein